MGIYSCLHIDTTGPTGTQLRPKAADDEVLVYLGELADRHYYAGVADTGQHSEIDLKPEALTDEIEALIKKSQVASANKQALRKKIESDVGDLHDLIADQAKTIEFLFVLTTRIAQEFLGGEVMSDDKKAEYLARVQVVTAALDANSVTLRGDFTDPSSMLTEVIGRTDAINKLVKSDYIEKLDELTRE